MKQLRPYQQDAFDLIRKRLKESCYPILVNASVGAGKTIIISSLLKVIENANWNALCLTMNSNLIEQNAESYKSQGGTCGIFCTGLGEKNTDSNIIFASPHSIVQGLKKNNKIKNVKFNLIIVDECHNIDHKNNKSMYMRILNHYGFMAQNDNYSFRVIGLTGTPYRGKNESIVGQDQYFKQEDVTIGMPWLIENGYLVAPVFGQINTDTFDMSSLRVDNTGKFKHKDLQHSVNKDERLTGEIMREVVSVIESGRNGAFIFASTVQHAYECMRSLPGELAAIITAKTKARERKQILSDARNGKIKYLVNVATLLVGVDVPNFDVCAWLRPTESLILYVQGIGRVLRLSQGKTDALVLDYAGNIERHGDIDDPVINKAIEQKDKDDEEYCIPCFTCNTLNKVTARRCIGNHNQKRCDHYFTFKACPKCETENDIVSRECRSCKTELIDPNSKLKKITETNTLDVLTAKYWVNESSQACPIVNAHYKTNDIDVYEVFFVASEKAKHIFYAKFVKQHIEEPHKYYTSLQNVNRMKYMLFNEKIKTPYQVVCKLNKHGRYEVAKKLFY